MRMKMIPPPMEMGRLCVAKRERGFEETGQRESAERRKKRTYKCTAVMMLDTPHWSCMTFA